MQHAIRADRERFIEATAASLPCADPRAAARMVLALVNGLLLHQLSAPDAELDALAPASLIATGAAAMTFPLAPPPGT